MLLFGHIGFTLAAGLLLNNILPKKRILADKKTNLNNTDSIPPYPPKDLSQKYWSLILRSKNVDLRFLIIGSLLPDIIDKPIGQYLFQSVFGSGRIFGHTLLFFILLLLIGLFAKAKFKNSLVLVLSFGAFTHLILDFMWFSPGIFLWPLFGFTFIRFSSVPLQDYLIGLIKEVYQVPTVAIPELLGAAIAIWFVWLVVRKGKFRTFMRTGHV
jgi:inner membrane protein